MQNKNSFREAARWAKRIENDTITPGLRTPIVVKEREEGELNLDVSRQVKRRREQELAKHDASIDRMMKRRQKTKNSSKEAPVVEEAAA